MDFEVSVNIGTCFTLSVYNGARERGGEPSIATIEEIYLMKKKTTINNGNQDTAEFKQDFPRMNQIRNTYTVNKKKRPLV